MSAGQYNFIIEQGSTFQRTLIYKDENGDPVDLTPYDARMMIKAAKADTEAILSLSNETEGGLTLGGAAGTIAILISAEDTEDLDFDSAYYDLEIETDEVVTRLLEGTVTLSKEVTN
jgi:hypothetical protein